MNHSPSLNDLLIVKQTDINKKSKDKVTKSLIQDVSTRWNSTFLMLQRVLELKHSQILVVTINIKNTLLQILRMII